MIYFAYAYGIITIIGGLMGYLKAHSTVSLISGTISGLLVLASAFALMKGKSLGYYGLVALSILLTLVFIERYMKTHAFMPAGLMIALSALTLIGLLLKRPELLQNTH